MGKTLEELLRDGLRDEPIGRSGKIRTARGRLAAFLADLPPVFCRLLSGVGLTGWEAIDYDELNDDDRARLPEMTKEYRRLLRSVLRELARAGDRQGLVIADYERVHAGHSKWSTIRMETRRGAPQKEIEQRVDVLRLRRFLDISAKLRAGFALKKQLLARDGFSSDPEEIKKALQRVRPALEREEADAILKAPSLRQASLLHLLHLLQAAQQTHLSSASLSKASLSSSIQRGKALLEAAKARGNLDDQ